VLQSDHAKRQHTLCRPSRAHDDASLSRCAMHRSDEDASSAYVQPCAAAAAGQDDMGAREELGLQDQPSQYFHRVGNLRGVRTGRSSSTTRQNRTMC
jgi:hypothetical protein